MKSPLRNSLAACAAALALVLLAALAQPAEAQEKKTNTEQLLQAELNKFWSDENGWTQLHWAAAADDGEAVRRLLELGANPNITDNSDGGDFNIKGKQRLKLLGKKHARGKNVRLTPLHAAALLDSPVVASILIAGGADIRAKTNSGLTPLHFAALLNKPEVAALLIEGGAAVNVEDKRGETPLDYAVERGKTEVAAVLRENQAERRCDKYKGIYDLSNAIKANNTVRVECAIRNGVSVHSSWGTREPPPLHKAAENNSVDIAKLLIDNGADVNDVDIGDGMPLHFAARNNAPEVAKLLIDNGADVNAKLSDYDDDTPLHIAARNNAPEVAKVLSEALLATLRGTPPPTGTKTEKFLRKRSRWGGHLDVNARVDTDQLFINKTANLNTHLHIAAARADMEATGWLIANGADINARVENSNIDKTPLIKAASRSSEGLWIVQLLIANGAEVNAKTEDGDTPLHRAAFHNAEEVAKLLIANGADVNAKISEHALFNPGYTPMDLAIATDEDGKKAKIQSILRQHGGRCNKKC